MIKMSKKDTREIVGKVNVHGVVPKFSRGCTNFNHHETVQVFIYNENYKHGSDGKWVSVMEFPLGCCLNQSHPNFKKPCLYFKLD